MERLRAAGVGELEPPPQRLAGVGSAVAAPQRHAQLGQRSRALEQSGRILQHLDRFAQQRRARVAFLDEPR